MSNLDARIMKFMTRKEEQYPELRQPSVVLYRSLKTEESRDITEEADVKTYRKALTHPFRSNLFAA